MTSGPITLWQIYGKKVKVVTDFIVLSSKITCRQWLQPWNQKTLAPWKESCDIPRKCIKKQRHHFAEKGPYSQSYGCSSSLVRIWELDHKKAEHRRINAFELWCWRRLLRVPWTAKRSNQSILKEINPEYWLERLMLKLKLQYVVYLMPRANSLEKALMLANTEGRGEGIDRGWDGWMASSTQWTWVWANSRR